MPKGKKAILVDARIDEDSRIVQLGTDTARWAYVVALTRGKWTTPEGRFDSETHLRGVLGRHSKYVPDFLRLGLVTVGQDGSYTFPSWSEWQRESEAAVVRTKRWREKKRLEEEGVIQLLPMVLGDVTVTSRERHGDGPNANANANAETTKVRRGRSSMADLYGQDAATAIAAYWNHRVAAGLKTDRAECGKLARPLMKMRVEGWDLETCVRAVERYAATKRSPLYFREWVLQEFHAEGDEQHEQRTAELDAPLSEDAKRAIAGGTLHHLPRSDDTKIAERRCTTPGCTVGYRREQEADYQQHLMDAPRRCRVALAQ